MSHFVVIGRVLVVSFSIFTLLGFQMFPVVFAQEQGATSIQVVSPEKAATVREKALELVQDEVDLFGSFEVDNLETGEFLELSLGKVEPGVMLLAEDEYQLRATLNDVEGKTHQVNLILLEFEEGDYELVDALLADAK
jgi:hypothetical protein